MKGGKRPLGYTIIEVMIVLAVSGVMFIIAASFISGKEASSAFTEGSNEFASQLQAIIAQVVNGQYSDISFTCSASALNALTFTKTPPNPANPNAGQGTNSACDFLGKFMQFSVTGVQADDEAVYEVFSIAGARTDDTLASATPIVQLPAGAPGNLDLTTHVIVPQSLNVTSVKVVDDQGNTHVTDGIGFVQSQGSCDSDDNCTPGAQTVNMVYAPELNSANSEAGAINDITGNLTTNVTSATICLSDGTRYAQIILGDSNNLSSPLNVSVQVVGSC